MGKFSFISIGVLGLLLIGCNDNKAQTEQLAKIQARLDEQERQNHLLQAQVKEKEEQRAREEELRKADAQAQDTQNAKNTQANTKTNQPTAPTNTPPNPPSQPKPSKPTQTQTPKSESKPATAKFSEKPARYPATIVTSSGYGALSLRGEPSIKGIQAASVYDGEEVQVIAETNRCEVIDGARGCWYKVDIGGVKGYMFSAYLQRELISQAEKQFLYQNHESDEEEDVIY